jgi:hypothetical protein
MNAITLAVTLLLLDSQLETDLSDFNHLRLGKTKLNSLDKINSDKVLTTTQSFCENTKLKQIGQEPTLEWST